MGEMEGRKGLKRERERQWRERKYLGEGAMESLRVKEKGGHSEGARESKKESGEKGK